MKKKYGAYHSIKEVKSAIESGNCTIAVNHFAPAKLLQKMTKSKLLIWLAYAQKIIIPALVVFALSQSVYPSNLFWLPMLFYLVFSYVVDVDQVFLVLGMSVGAIAVVFHNNLLALFTLPIIASFLCSRLWWTLASKLVTRQVLSDWDLFQELWDEQLILFVVDGKTIYSVSGEGSVQGATS